MRFPGFGSPRRGNPPSWRLGGPLGERKVVLRLSPDGELELRTKGGELLEAHPLRAVAWHAAVLPGKEHALALQLINQQTELLLRAKTKEQVEAMAQQLRDTGARQLQPLPAAGRPWSAPPSAQPPPHEAGRADMAPDPRSLSFGSPVVEGDVGGADQADGGGTAWRPAAAAAGRAEEALSEASEDEGLASGSAGESEDEGGLEPELQGWPSPAAALPAGTHGAAPCHRSAPASPVLPGLPLVAADPAAAAIARRPSASAPVSPAHRASRRHVAFVDPETSAAPDVEPPMQVQPPPVRLLSFSDRPGGESVLSHVQRLEAAVAQLSSELAQSQRAGSCGGSPVKAAPAPAAAPPAAPCAANATGAASLLEAAAACAPEGALAAGVTTDAVAGNRRPPAAVAPAPTSGSQVELLLHENALLLHQQAAMQAELGRMQGQLSAAAANNVRLAQEAAAAVQQLAAAAEAARAGQQREQSLHSSLAAAVGQCEAVGRELAGLSGKLEAKAVLCKELRRAAAVEALSKDKTELTAALTTARVHLQDATPAGFAAESAELRRQAEAAQREAAAARAAAAEAAARVAEAQRREAEVAGHMQEAARCMDEAQAARAAALDREQQLAAEIRSLRQRLAGKLPAGDPARALQERADQLAAANSALQQDRAALLAQVQQLQAVGQELSTSCRALDAGMQGAAREREALQAALSQAQAAHAAAQQQWQQQRQQLESSLSAASVRLSGTEDSAESSRAQVAALQGQLDSLRSEAAAAQQQAAAREQELQAELRLLSVKAEAEQKRAADRAEAAAAAHAAEAVRQQEALRSREAELEAARKEAARLAAEHGQAQEELRRAKEESFVRGRDLQLESSTAKAEAARLAQELRTLQDAADQQRQAAEEGRRAAQQAQAQLAAAVAAHTALSQERKELEARLDRAAVERDRAARGRDAAELQCAALQQQCRLLEAVAAAATGRASRGGGASKEKGGGTGGAAGAGGGSDGEPLIKAHRGAAGCGAMSGFY